MLRGVARRIAALHLRRRLPHLPPNSRAPSHPTSSARSQTLARRPPALLFRALHVSDAVQKDTHHLDEKGQIKEAVLKERYELIRSQGFLCDPIFYEQQTIYFNWHILEGIKTEENLERMREGKAPLDRLGAPIHIHHVDQTHHGPLVICTKAFHEGFTKELHSHVHLKDGVRRSAFNRQKASLWKYIGKRLEFSEKSGMSPSMH